jgi:lysophospholipase L1-like esterase
VDVITVTLWANDVNELSVSCANDIACVRRRAPAALVAFAKRLGSILDRLHAAAPKARIVVTGAWSDDVAAFAKTISLYRAVDQAIRTTAAAHGARFAELMPVFNPTTGTRAAVCRLTFVCARADGHPTDAGYRAIAAAVASALASSGG